MDNKIKVAIAASLILGIAGLSMITQATTNDYYAFQLGIQDFDVLGDGQVNVTFPVAYIPVTGSSTYTLTTGVLVSTINLSQPQQINTQMKNTIVNEAVIRGYNIKKIIMQGYNIVSP